MDRIDIYRKRLQLDIMEKGWKKIHSLIPVLASPYKLIRVGNKNGDGGYIMADYFPDNAVAYSFGIGNDVSWDEDIAERVTTVYMYDHTISKLPPYKNTDKLIWKPCGISSSTSGVFSTLQRFIFINGHSTKNNMILKLDVEGAEYDVIASTPTDVFEHFSQIVIEFHNMHIFENIDTACFALEKLLKTHMPIHVHANNVGRILKINDVNMPELLEVTYINKKLFKGDEELTECIYPRNEIDVRNCYYNNDIILGYWNI